MYSNVVRALGARRLVAAGALFALVVGSSGAALAGAVSITSPGSNATVSGEVTINLSVSSNVWWTRLSVDKAKTISGYNPLIWNSTTVKPGKHTLTVAAYPKGGSKAIGYTSVAVMVGSAPTATPTNTATPTPSGTSTPSATATPSSTPSPVSYFSTLPYNATLPSESQCASEIATTPETASWNTAFNQTKPTSSQLSSYASNGYVFGSTDDLTQYKRVDGQYTGSTDMIVRWAACKYGIDENVVRAQAWVESGWQQGGAGDEQFSQSACVQGNFTALWNTSISEPDGSVVSVPNGCYQSWSAWQTKVYYAWMTWPEIMQSTAFGADYRYADQRACMDGAYKSYFQSGNQQPNTYATDLSNYENNPSTSNTNRMLWGCIGQHYSGSWYDSGAQSYISAVQSAQSSAPWPK